MWLLLIHQLPPKPDYVRVKIRRRLAGIGAVAIKNTVYVLPNRATQSEDFHWLLKEIGETGGEACICAADIVEGLDNASVTAMFNTARDQDYESLAERLRTLLRASREGKRESEARAGLLGESARLRGNFEQIAKIDFFGTAGRSNCATLLAQIESALQAHTGPPAPVSRANLKEHQNRVWVTRADVFVDRMASAWLIRRRIDKKARFKFVAQPEIVPAAGEIRFDMFDAEFTHQGDRCTFEVLLDSFSLDDLGLLAIAEIVHDLDLKDEKFRRAEGAGIEAAFRGIVLAHETDQARVDHAMTYFDHIYTHFAQKELAHGGSNPRRKS